MTSVSCCFVVLSIHVQSIMSGNLLLMLRITCIIQLYALQSWIGMQLRHDVSFLLLFLVKEALYYERDTNSSEPNATNTSEKTASAAGVKASVGCLFVRRPVVSTPDSTPLLVNFGPNSGDDFF